MSASLARILFAIIPALLFRAVAQEGGEALTHAQLIERFDAAAFERGKELYQTACMTCHGTPEQEGSLPTSRPFWKEPFKNGSDPFSIYRTLTEGLGQMPAWIYLTPQQRYDAVHYVREAFVKPLNPAAYFAVTPEYLAGLPKTLLEAAEVAGSQEGPPYLRMDFGPALFWTIQAEPNNIAYKGIAVRLDGGPGGISKGRAWILYDHDTMRVAAGWTGDKFIDWRGIGFDGSHGTHASIVGEKAFVNAVGPGWANPETGSFEDPRLRGRDGKHYGPLPREWSRLQGVYFHGERVVIAYSIGDARVLESPGYENGVFTRALNIGKSSRDLTMRIAPASVKVGVSGSAAGELRAADGYRVLRIPASATPIDLTLAIGGNSLPVPALDLSPFTNGAPARWNPPLATRGKLGADDGPFAVDELSHPPAAANPWGSWMRFGGFDFFKDGKRAAIGTWNGDVWIVSGIDDALAQLTWKRIATGLFQPLGVRLVNEQIYVTCRDQIARLHDLNGDEEIDFVESFNSDHQVTEHFHEFAMGLQTDAAGNFYYAKSARHALPAVVPHHGTLLKVSADGSRTDILATGFRAANGVCVNEDGTFFVTDQEGHWTPKNRINLVRAGGFYGNMFGYHERTSSADGDMEQPLVWITNEMDRSPGELVRIAGEKWGALKGRLLNLSYGTGRIYVVPHEMLDGQPQGGVSPLPIADLPTGVMRGRFHPTTGDLYACGMYAWAGNQQGDGGFYRVRPTGKPAWVPVGLRIQAGKVEIDLSDPVEPVEARKTTNYQVSRWALKRSADYGSRHHNQVSLGVDAADVTDDGKTIRLQIADLAPTQGMEIKLKLRGMNGETVTRTIHNTIHQVPKKGGAVR